MSIALELSEQKLTEIDKEIEAKVGNLLGIRDALAVDIKKLKRGTGSNGAAGPTIPDEQLVETVGTFSEPASSKEIAAALGVDSRTVARRLSKMAADGTISGDKEAGYSAA